MILEGSPDSHPPTGTARLDAARNVRWLVAGLCLVSLATIMLEILDSRLLSVLTWYHLAFLAVSLAMLGMAAGAVLVFLGGERYTQDTVGGHLSRTCVWFAAAIPFTHLMSLVTPIPILEFFAPMEVIALALAMIVLGTPFLLAGIVVTLALTRTGAPVGRLYALDLVGAAMGCLLVIPLLEHTNITSVALIAGAIAAFGAYCFQRFAGSAGRRLSLSLCAGLLAIAGLNAVVSPINIVYAKNRKFRPNTYADAGSLHPREYIVDWSAWNTYSYLAILPPARAPAFYWGRGRGGENFEVTLSWILIDAEAGTPITQWSGDKSDLAWVGYDVTALPYYLRQGHAAIIGVGGGRDILSAIWAGSHAITGIDINANLFSALKGPYREFARFVDRPEVELVRSEARSYLTRTTQRFDVLQMSLIDTWAATGAGAFTLSENGLYTVEAWRVFLDRLAPGGLFSVSRWFSPQAASETNRLVALATAALLDRGIRTPVQHIVMMAAGTVATLIVSNEPLTDSDASVVTRLAADRGFKIMISPWTEPADARLGRISRARSEQELDRVTHDPVFDFTAPTDAKPFFFNTLKPASFYKVYDLPRGGVMWGNLRATWTLVVLFATALVLVCALIAWPLLQAGRPAMGASNLLLSISYFAMIGVGYLLIQIPFLQRFSVYLGHPTYTFSIILFSMILFTGIGSFLTDRLPPDRHRWIVRLPLVVGVWIVGLVLLVQPLMDSTFHLSQSARSLIVVACTAPISVLLGFFFPLGMRLVGRLSPDATAWMWGVNGAAGVLASIAAVAISMWLGIHINLLLAALIYGLLAIPAHLLARRAFEVPTNA